MYLASLLAHSEKCIVAFIKMTKNFKSLIKLTFSLNNSNNSNKYDHPNCQTLKLIKAKYNLLKPIIVDLASILFSSTLNRIKYVSFNH